jgi:hypothetical protein
MLQETLFDPLCTYALEKDSVYGFHHVEDGLRADITSQTAHKKDTIAKARLWLLNPLWHPTTVCLRGQSEEHAQHPVT